MFNDQSVDVRLQYLTFANLWHFSGDRDRRALLERLVPIDGAPKEVARALASPVTTLTEAALRELF